ncbi:hypothetical protein LWI29_036158 [Acer saccharum]|uniref:Uncharacterized protein n=1 Tax=Acer saccharum TaxID=4024 RepID=A0AA39VH58_ACESA|nr:hypothetical protein LWI29_036158 [Acer saccharum]
MYTSVDAMLLTEIRGFYGDWRLSIDNLTKLQTLTEIGPFPSSFGEKAKVKVRVQLNLHGIVNVQSASLISESMDDSETRRDASSTSEVNAKSDHTPAVANDDELFDPIENR